MTSIVLRRTTEASNDELRQIEQIYSASFPPSERQPFSELRSEIESGIAKLYLANDADQIVAFAIVVRLKANDVGYLPYIAVREDYRNQRIGGRFIRYVLDQADREEAMAGLIWEAESDEHGTPAERELSARRIQFYIRNGGVVLEEVGDYRMPDFRGPGSLPLKLMWSGRTTNSRPSNDEIAAYIEEIFRVIYNRSRTDPLLHYVLSTIKKQ